MSLFAACDDGGDASTSGDLSCNELRLHAPGTQLGTQGSRVNCDSQESTVRLAAVDAAIPSARMALMEGTTSMGLARGSFRGLEVYSASTSVRRKR